MKKVTLIFLAIACWGAPSLAQSTYQETAAGQTPGVGPLTKIRVCGIVGIPGGCVERTVPENGGLNDVAALQRIETAQLADVRAKIDALTAAVKELKASNDAAAKANQEAAKAIHDQNVQFNSDFANAIMQKLNNYSADFINSPAYQKLKQDLTDMINQRLSPPAPAAPSPATSATQSPQRTLASATRAARSTAEK